LNKIDRVRVQFLVRI